MLSLREPQSAQAAENDDLESTKSDGPGAIDAHDLAKKLQNPIADLISVPLQFNFEFGGGVDIPEGNAILRVLPRGAARFANRLLESERDQATRYVLNFQPVIPISLSAEWNVVSRTILPIVYEEDFLGATSQGGLGDTVQSFFLSPKSAEPFIWGAGPVLLLPTASDDSLGSERWGMGPTGVILEQSGPWTYGALANHIWSFARDDRRKEVNRTFLQPFLAYTTKSATTFNLNTESTYDWDDDQWTVPIQAGISQLVKLGQLPVSIGLFGRYWAEGPESAPDWSIRFVFTFLFPK